MTRFTPFFSAVACAVQVEVPPSCLADVDVEDCCAALAEQSHPDAFERTTLDGTPLDAATTLHLERAPQGGYMIRFAIRPDPGAFLADDAIERPLRMWGLLDAAIDVDGTPLNNLPGAMAWRNTEDVHIAWQRSREELFAVLPPGDSDHHLRFGFIDTCHGSYGSSPAELSDAWLSGEVTGPGHGSLRLPVTVRNELL